MLKEIQKLDYDRYISLIFTPRDKREDIIAIILFNLEIAKIKNRVTEPMMGHIRLQWWREAFDEIYDESRTVRSHELINKLIPVIKKYSLPKEDFITLINAREKDLEEQPFPTILEFRQYVTDTSYPVNKICLRILGVNNDAISNAVKHISISWAIMAMLRSAYKNFSANRVIFPLDLMTASSLDPHSFGNDNFIQDSKKLVEHLTEMANIEYKQGKEILKTAPKAERKKAKPVLLMAEIADYHINQVNRNRFDIFTRGINPFLGIHSLAKIYLTR